MIPFALPADVASMYAYTPPPTVEQEVSASTSGLIDLVPLPVVGLGLRPSPPEEGERIFEKFRRSEGINEKGMGSSGIGLHVSKKLVQHMGGGIGHRARRGGGSIFFFHMKLGVFDAQIKTREKGAV